MLKISNVSKNFSGLTALNKVNLTVPKNSIFSLIGPNGAGKTTLFNLISGLWPVSEGNIYFGDIDITKLKAQQIPKLGISRTFQNIRLFNEMTVYENVWAGQHHLTNSGFKSLFSSISREERRLCENVQQILSLAKLRGKENVIAKNLSYGDQRRLEIARAIAARPKLLLLDEPAAGMNPHESAILIEEIKGFKGMGITIFLIEHDMSVVMNVADLIAVINFGVKIAEGTPSEIQRNKAVIDAYLGDEATE